MKRFAAVSQWVFLLVAFWHAFTPEAWHWLPNGLSSFIVGIVFGFSWVRAFPDETKEPSKPALPYNVPHNLGFGEVPHWTPVENPPPGCSSWKIISAPAEFIQIECRYVDSPAARWYAYFADAPKMTLKLVCRVAAKP